MRRTLVVGNWKMNGSLAFAENLLAEFKVSAAGFRNVDSAVCPPYIYVATVADQLQNSGVAWGAQNLSEQAQGAYTGEVSATMLADLGCRYVIVGHSERRSLYAETDALVAEKFVAAQEKSLTPILCVGETLAQREAGETLAVIAGQLRAVIEKAGVDALASAVVAYEPVWAIGTGKTATPEQAQEVHGFIRQQVKERSAVVAEGLQILYGGSVKANNAAQLFAQSDIDGALVGGASLDAKEFASICEAGE